MKIPIRFLVSVLLVLLGLVAVWEDLLRQNPISVEWTFLAYRPTYLSSEGKVLPGLWTLDWFQVSLALVIILNLGYLKKGLRKLRQIL
jgi:hypothetical protein